MCMDEDELLLLSSVVVEGCPSSLTGFRVFSLRALQAGLFHGSVVVSFEFTRSVLGGRTGQYALPKKLPRLMFLSLSTGAVL